MIPEYLQTLIKKYREGYQPEKQHGKVIKANPYVDFEKFTEYLIKKSRVGTIRQYLSYLHLWMLPVNEETITNWGKSIDFIDDQRHEYKTSTTKKTFMPKYLSKGPDKKTNSNKRLSYYMRNVMKIYLISTDQKKLLNILEEKRDIKTPMDNIKDGHFTDDEFNSFISAVPDMQQKMLFKILYHTGGRINEILNMKLSNSWIPTYIKKEKVKFENNKVFEITIPEGFAKSKTSETQKLFLDNMEFVQEFIEYLNEKNDSEYIFKLHRSLNETKVYMDIQKEKNVLNDTIQSALQLSGLTHKNKLITIHSFRRTFVHKRYDEFGHDIELTRSLARHSDIKVTDRYLHTGSEAAKKRLQDKLDGK